MGTRIVLRPSHAPDFENQYQDICMLLTNLISDCSDQNALFNDRRNLSEDELPAINRHAVHNHGKLSDNRKHVILNAGPFGAA